MAQTIYPFKWYFRPEITPVIVVGDSGEEYNFDQLPGLLSEIDVRHWRAIRQILIEAKYKAEQQLRNDAVIKDSRLSAYYQGWVNYADYVLSNFEGLRSGEVLADQHLGAEETSETIR